MGHKLLSEATRESCFRDKKPRGFYWDLDISRRQIKNVASGIIKTARFLWG